MRNLKGILLQNLPVIIVGLLFLASGGLLAYQQRQIHLELVDLGKKVDSLECQLELVQDDTSGLMAFKSETEFWLNSGVIASPSVVGILEQRLEHCEWNIYKFSGWANKAEHRIQHIESSVR